MSKQEYCPEEETHEDERCVERWRERVRGITSTKAVFVNYNTLSDATEGLSEGRVIAGGASCSVYRANVYKFEVAIKAIKPMLFDSADEVSAKKERSNQRQFRAEMSLLQVRFFGGCK
jgi:hypothetical protein